MKVAIFSESSADETALRVIVDAVLGQPTEPVELLRLRNRRGISNVFRLLPSIYKYVHYQTEADGLVVVVDSNGSPLHALEHETGARDPQCHFCMLKQAVEETRRTVRDVPGRQRLMTAIGLAAPALEAWYRCGIDPTATEPSWNRELAAGAVARHRIVTLKKAVYGTERPSLELETTHATAQMHRLASQLDLLERDFPVGFGVFAQDLRAWLAR